MDKELSGLERLREIYLTRRNWKQKSLLTAGEKVV